MTDTNIERLARRFLDTEADVDDDEYDEQELDDQDEDLGVFLEDDSEITETPRPQKTLAIDKAPAEFWENLVNNAEVQARIARRHRQTINDDLLENHLPFVPRDDDYPLWRVPCRRGIEDEAVISLCGTAGPKHQLRSAFARSEIPGYVYLECTMNTELQELLQITPGLRGFGSRRREMIDIGEYTGVMGANQGIRVGEWIKIRNGLYKGDLAVVDSKDRWGVQALVVPRLSPGSKTGEKRKASTSRPRARLLDVEEQRRSSRYHVREKGSNKYRIGRLDFDHLLLKKHFDLSSITRHPVDIPCNHLEEFKFSRHPRLQLSSVPRPREWSYQVGDRVQILSSSRVGYITVIETIYAEVDFSDDPSMAEEVRHPWVDIAKFFEVGNQVEILNGPRRGVIGWITNITDHISTVAIMEKESKKSFANPAEEIVSLNNNLRFYIPPIVLQPGEKSEAPLASTGRHWWCEREVLIMKEKHPHKGEKGLIVDVIPTQDPLNSKVLIKLNAYRPAQPQLRILIEAKEVRDTLTKKRLEGPVDERKRESRPLLTPADVESGSQTPMPSEPYGGTTPAWDPNAPSPWEFPPSTAPVESRPRPITPKPTHILLNPLFDGLEIKAIVNGDGFNNKECAVKIIKCVTVVIMSTKRQRTRVHLDPLGVTPKAVNAKLDDNLLVVIEGEHVGKLGRRIHHIDGFAGPTAIILAIVKRHDPLADTLTGEQVEVPPSSVAIVVECEMEKKGKKNLMKDLRAPWQGK